MSLTAPSPSDQTSKDTAQDRSDTTSQRPDAFGEALHTSISQTTPTIPPAKQLTINKLRCLKLNKSLMQTCTNRINPPPAVPWNARPMINSCIVFAVAQTAELAKKMASAANMMGLRPQMSDNLAQMGPEAALASRYAPPIQV